MENKEYCARIVDTQKAEKYINRKKFDYICDWIVCDGTYFMHFVVACEDQKAMEHIMNAYPNAVISFASAQSVREMKEERENAWLMKVRDVVWNIA